MVKGLVVLLLTVVCPVGAASAAVDEGGRPASVSTPAQRIVALAPDIVENLFAIGAGDRLVGRVAFSDYPEAALSLPLVGDYQRLNVEAILALKPDLVLGWREGNPPDQLRRLERFGIPLVRLSTNRIEDIPRNLRLLGQLTALESEAEPVAALFETRLNTLKPTSGATPMLFYQLWGNPLMTVNDETLIGQAISLCGAVNPFGKRPESAPQVNIEAVIAAAPDLIVGTDELGSGWQKRWQEWPSLPAVRNDALYSLPADYLHRATPRFIEGLERLCSVVEISSAVEINRRAE